MALIQIINKLSNIPNGIFLNALETELLGGEYSEKEKKALIKRISALLIQYTKLLQAKTPIPINNIVDFDNLLKIPNDEQLYDLCIRLRESMQVISYLPQIFEIITFEVIQPNFKKLDESLFLDISNFNKEEISKIKTIINHILIFFERIGVFKREEINFLLEI